MFPQIDILYEVYGLTLDNSVNNKAINSTIIIPRQISNFNV